MIVANTKPAYRPVDPVLYMTVKRRSFVWNLEFPTMRAIMKGLTDAEFERLYGSEALCLAALVAERQRIGMPCPRCGNDKSYVYGRRVGCTRCDRRWSVTAGTVMADTKLPLRTWFRAMHMMTCTKQGLSAMELGRRLGVCYATAWYLHKRLRHAMTTASAKVRLGGDGDDPHKPVVEADDVHLGGERNKGRGTAGKIKVIAACERHDAGPVGRMGRVALTVVHAFSTVEVRRFRDAHTTPNAVVHTDALAAFNAFGGGGRTHVATRTGGKRPGRERTSPFFTINTLIANLSTALKATFKRFSAKHIPDYLGAFCWTTNRRRSMHTMIPSLCRALASASRLTRSSVYASPA